MAVDKSHAMRMERRAPLDSSQLQRERLEITNSKVCICGNNMKLEIMGIQFVLVTMIVILLLGQKSYIP